MQERERIVIQANYGSYPIMGGLFIPKPEGGYANEDSLWIY